MNGARGAQQVGTQVLLMCRRIRDLGRLRNS
jgi:hypothetical protein